MGSSASSKHCNENRRGLRKGIGGNEIPGLDFIYARVRDKKAGVGPYSKKTTSRDLAPLVQTHFHFLG